MIVVALRPENSDFYLTAKQLEFFELLVKRDIVNRETAFDQIYGRMIEADQPQDDKVLDQMLVVIRRKCRAEGVNILTVSNGWSIRTTEKERARKLIDIAKAQPKRRVGVAAGISKFNSAKIGKFEWKIDKEIPLPQLDNYGNLKQYFFEDLEIGDSVFIKGKKKSSVKHSIYAVRREHKDKYFFMVEREEKGEFGTRVWRVKQNGAAKKCSR